MVFITTQTTPRAVRLAMACLVLVAAGCGDDDKRPFGSSCGSDEQCEGGLCVAQVCIDPAGDEDTDGLTNGLERQLGSDVFAADTDGDLIADRDELGPDFALTDTDADTIPDILESATGDTDADCITDQYDAANDVPDNDKSPMLSVVCRRGGICQTQLAGLAVDCSTGTAACDYSGITGFADPEAVCDGRDENCDGSIDEAFAGQACDTTARPWLAPGNGTYAAGSTRYRAALGFGPVPSNIATSPRYRVEVGFSPSLLSTEVSR